jgi:hypothetical protein
MSTGDHNEDELADHYMSFFCAEQEDAGGSRPPVRDKDMTDDGNDADEEMEDAEQDQGTGEETTTSGAGDGNDTTDGGGDRTNGREPKRRRKERRRNQLRTEREEITEVDPGSGLPILPEKVAKGYGINCACILRETVSINEENIRHKLKEPLAVLLISKLHG